MEEFDETELQKLMQESKGDIPFWQRLLLRFWPRMAFRYYGAKLDVNNRMLDKLHDTFVQSKRIDIIPLSANRGFMIVIDGKMSLWFYQEEDHFKYDGFEMGEYDKGDVTIFDKLKN